MQRRPPGLLPEASSLHAEAWSIENAVADLYDFAALSVDEQRIVSDAHPNEVGRWCKQAEHQEVADPVVAVVVAAREPFAVAPATVLVSLRRTIAAVVESPCGLHVAA